VTVQVGSQNEDLSDLTQTHLIPLCVGGVVKIDDFSLISTIGVRCGVSKGVDDGRRPPCGRATPETAVSSFQGWPACRARMLGHGRPGLNFRESMATPCNMPMFSYLNSQWFILGQNSIDERQIHSHLTSLVVVVVVIALVAAGVLNQ
jgi:hypothetical protein